MPGESRGKSGKKRTWSEISSKTESHDNEKIFSVNDIFEKKPIKLKCDCCKHRMPSKPFVRKPKPNLRIQAKVSGLDAHFQAGLRDGLVLGGHLHPVLQRLRHLFGLLNGVSSLPPPNVKHPLK